ncbi:HD family phosphohydrolase [Maribacter sp. 2307ULW6-5]|uniref:HD family phosphohydrolase n=1 Tax=Maribacter sp. 2307ULW6-5 TaxID=3386275 RepID=UPI0039BD4551
MYFSTFGAYISKKNLLDQLYKKQALIYKYVLYVAAVFLIVFFFPRGGKFKYEYQKGVPWQYEDLRAPFDFPIKKAPEQLNAERRAIAAGQELYFNYDSAVVKKAFSRLNELLDAPFTEGATPVAPSQTERAKALAREVLDQWYATGVVKDTAALRGRAYVYLIREGIAKRTRANAFQTLGNLEPYLQTKLQAEGLLGAKDELEVLLSDVVEPNVFFNETLTDKVKAEALSQLSLTRGSVTEGTLIIAKGEVVQDSHLRLLESLRTEYQMEERGPTDKYFVLGGYTVLVALVLMMLLLFLKKYRPQVFTNNTKVTFIFFNIVFLVLVTATVVNYDDSLVFVVPLCVLPLVLKTFFDARLGLFVHVLTVLILGFVVPNSFEYLFLQIIAGIVTILTVSELHKRTNLFVSVGQITLIYIVAYLAFHSIHEGNLNNIAWFTLGLFLLNGMITLFVQPLIYVYEKVFGLVSDVSLLELSDTNSALLKALSNKAPGTFHHSLQVANLAEAAANKVGANAMLVRVGALYHDIGKMENPTYFTENQITNVNPHHELGAQESAQIIIDHVIKGIELARKNNIPDRVVDFIRSHHGTTLVYYFFKKQQELDPGVAEDNFRYPGPLPFSKETAILMMADSVEAASKSLKNPTYLMIDAFVDKIIAGQMKAGQFVNANITFKEIEVIKKIFKQKLTNIYHLRVEYPE